MTQEERDIIYKDACCRLPYHPYAAYTLNQDDITDPDGNKGVTPKLEETIRELFKTVDLIDFG